MAELVFREIGKVGCYKTNQCSGWKSWYTLKDVSPALFASPVNKLMKSAKTAIGATMRWVWFCLLLVLAFAYLAAGLSPSDEPRGKLVADGNRLETKLGESIDAVSQNASLESQASEADLRGLPVSIKPAVEAINRLRLDKLQQHQLPSAGPADWMTICRRMSLALIGNGLSLEEIRQLERVPEAMRVRVHLDRLLVDSRYHNYWGERWTRFLVGTEGGQFVVYRRRRFRIWLTEIFSANRPYDQMVEDLITAEGLWTDKPQVNFLTATFDSNDGQADPIRLAARTSRAFLGLRIDCLQCHNDFLGNVNLGDVADPREGMQTDFHQLAAFFTSAKTSGLQGVKEGDVDYEYKYLDADEEVSVEPAVPFYPELLPVDGTPRQRLAAWVTHPKNRQAARAAVSHVWALMFGQAMGESVDNLPLDETMDPMIESLADDFVTHGFNIRRLIRLIALSDAFGVDSRASFEVTPEHERQNAVFPLVRLRSEQVAGSIIQAARIKKTDRESSLILQLQTFGDTNDFVTRYGDMGEEELTSDNITITQRLMMMNGKLVRELVKSNPVLNATSHINMFAGDDANVVEIVFLCVLNRYPTDAERDLFTSRLGEANNREDAIEDLYWVLLNSSELAWNH
jgi:hypothetical protein